MKHSTILLSTPQNSWDSLLCADDDYVEAIFLRRPGMTERLESVRVSTAESERCYDLALEALLRPLSRSEEAEIERFESTRAKIEAMDIPLELVDEN